MIRKLKPTEIDKFIDFGDELYKNDPNYVPYIRSDLKKTLKKLIFKRKKYKCICSFDESGKMNGRVLITIARNKQLNVEYCGYFSHFEVVNDQNVFNELMDSVQKSLKRNGAKYIVGSFFHHDPDNRRGILIEGFDRSPMIFTSHNPDYYKTLFENGGFEKLTDAYEYEYKSDPEKLQKIKDTAEKALKENSITISKLNMKNLDKEIDDVHTIMKSASTDVNFESVPSRSKLKKLVLSWKRFIDPDYAFIARRNSDGAPIGFTLSIPDYFELIKKMKGRTGPIALLVYLFGRKKIKGLRGVLQYIVPEYQHKGISKALYYETKKSVDKNHITRISLGTIMENNASSNGAIESLGGVLSRVYRVYYKKL